MRLCRTYGNKGPIIVSIYTALVYIECINVKNSAYFVKQGTFVNYNETIRCAVKSMDTDRIGMRTDITSGSCLPVYVSEYRDRFAEVGFNYFLKSLSMQWWSPGETFMETAISGVPTVGSYFEFRIQVDGSREFKIDLIDSVKGDRPFHCRPTTNNDVILNSDLLPGGFGLPERPATPFTEDRVYIMRFTYNQFHIQIDVDALPFYNYTHRTSYSRINKLRFRSDHAGSISNLEQLTTYFP